jgi:spermidine synthase
VLERLPLALALAALAVTVATPSWSGRLLDRGAVVYGRTSMDAADLSRFLRGYGSEQLYLKEGWNSAVSVWRDGNQSWLKVNGKVDASSVADMDTQVMLGLLPALAQPHPRRAFVVGFGSGATTRTLVDVPGVERVDVAEIESAVLRASRLFRDANRDVLDDPRVHVIEDDARSALLLAETPYDLIVSEPSNPWIAGVASLFTRDYYRVVTRRLASGGIFCQWLQMYRVTPGAVAVVIANLRAVFPHVEIWFSNASDLMVLASNEAIRWDRARIAALLAPNTRSGEAARSWLQVASPEDLLGHFLLGERGTASLAGGATFDNTDDVPGLEFEAARSLLAASLARPVFDSLTALKRAVGDSLPHLVNWKLGPGAWQEAFAQALPGDRAAALDAARQALDLAPRDPAREAGLGYVLMDRRQFAAARPLLDKAFVGRRDDPDLLFAAGHDRLALGDTAGAQVLFERVRAAGGDSVSAAALLAALAAKRGDYAGAAAQARLALEALRPTLARPFPDELGDVFETLANHAPQQVVEPLIDLAVATRPSWQLAYWAGAVLDSRIGGGACERALRFGGELRRRFAWSLEEVAAAVRRCVVAG